MNRLEDLLDPDELSLICDDDLILVIGECLAEAGRRGEVFLDRMTNVFNSQDGVKTVKQKKGLDLN